jgi:hypothetical protein
MLIWQVREVKDFSKKKISKEIDEYKPLAENIKVP